QVTRNTHIVRLPLSIRLHSLPILLLRSPAASVPQTHSADASPSSTPAPARSPDRHAPRPDRRPSAVHRRSAASSGYPSVRAPASPLPLASAQFAIPRAPAAPALPSTDR